MEHSRNKNNFNLLKERVNVSITTYQATKYAYLTVYYHKSKKKCLPNLGWQPPVQNNYKLKPMAQMQVELEDQFEIQRVNGY